MSQVYPANLVSSREKIITVRESICDSCLITRRSLIQLGDEIDHNNIPSAIWIQTKELFSLSVNVYLCKDHDHIEDSELEDVLYIVPKEINPEVNESYPFPENNEDPAFSIHDKGYLIIKHSFIKSITLDCEDRSNGQNPEKFKAIIKCGPAPLLYNVLHCEFNIFRLKENQEIKIKLGEDEKVKSIHRSISSAFKTKVSVGNILAVKSRKNT